MISLELASNGELAELPVTPSLGVEIDQERRSDREPSLWQERIIDEESSGPLIHIFDSSFIGSNEQRWLYEAVDARAWERFRFKEKEESDFFAVLKSCVEQCGSVWLLTDAQFGPKARVYQSRSVAQFLSLYRRAGIRINSAMPIVP